MISYKKREVTKENTDKLRNAIQTRNTLGTSMMLMMLILIFKKHFLAYISIPEKSYSKKDSKTRNKSWITKGFIKSTRIKNYTKDLEF